jgi:hypothetical protein
MNRRPRFFNARLNFGRTGNDRAVTMYRMRHETNVASCSGFSLTYLAFQGLDRYIEIRENQAAFIELKN